MASLAAESRVPGSENQLMESTSVKSLDSSFRDPAGFMFEHEGRLYRQVNHAGRECY